ncbi:MAG: putative addiction module antidote protein [Holophagaceae bacterium]|nr:putative addiction module antidote protein [Holophagaceae bacterium]
MESTKRRTPRPSSARSRVAEPVTTPYEAAENLTSEARMAALLEAALEDGNPQVVAAALGTLARAKGMAKIAEDTGLNPKSLYRALSGEGNPELDTFLKVIHALGLQLHASAI